MSFFKNTLPKFTALLFAGICISVVNQNNSYADAESYLAQIANYTNGILNRVNNLPTFLSTIATSSASLIAQDNSSATSSLQSNLTQYTNAFLQNSMGQTSLQSNIINTLLINPATNKPVTAEELPNANDLLFQSMMGMSYFAKDPRGDKADIMLNYISNASGIGLIHTVPSLTWRGGPEAQITYSNFYNTMMAAESFNGWVLSDMYADAKNGGQLNTLQQALVKEVSDPNTWFSKIASEDIGIVLRQILLFQSQNFALMTESIKVQKQLLYAQAMNNSLLILLNYNNEDLLVRRAQGTMPAGG